MILPVRPHFLFDQVKEEDRLISIPLPERNSGSPSLLETYLLMAVGKIVRPKRIFEIGTYTGQTTRNLSRNFPEAEIFTLDLDPFHAEIPAASYPSVTRMQAHSMQFDFTPWYGTCGLVFVDGGHDYATVKADTETALKLLLAPHSSVPFGPSAIVWHDYGNVQFPDVTKYLLSVNLSIHHVLDTQIAVFFAPHDTP